MGSFPDPTCIDLPQRNGNLQDVIYCNLTPSADASCVEPDPCPDPPKCLESMARIANTSNDIQEQDAAMDLIDFFLNAPDSVNGDSLAIDYLVQRASTDSLALSMLVNINNRSKALSQAITDHDPSGSVYLDENYSENLKHNPSTFKAYPHRIEQIPGSFRFAKTDSNDPSDINLTVIPNPNSGDFEIRIDNKNSETSFYDLKIIDNLGKVIYDKKRMKEELIKLDLKMYPNGIYHVIVVNDQAKISQASINIIR